MIYQFNVLKKLLKSDFWKLLVIYIIFYFCVYCIIKISSIDIVQKDFQFLVGIFTIVNFDFLEYLWIIFQVVCIAYISWSYLIYENNHSKEFLYLRKSLYKIFLEKLFTICFLILIIRIAIFSISIIMYLIMPVIFVLYEFIIAKFAKK